jgi:ABC-type branched-subunit amino acid transport system ATPase component
VAGAVLEVRDLWAGYCDLAAVRGVSFALVPGEVLAFLGVLSGGEQQILSMGRALAGSPRVLLVDELSLGLAPLVVDRLLSAIRWAADETGLAMLARNGAS